MVIKKALMIVVLLATFFVSGCAPKRPAMDAVPLGTGTLMVFLDGFRNSQGNVIVSLFHQAKGFPEDMDRAVKNTDTVISDRKARVVFENLPYGEYALSVLHDENRNGKMDSNLMGIPREGHGASNNPQKQFAPPKFEEARFLLDSEEKPLTVSVRYFKRKTPWNNS